MLLKLLLLLLLLLGFRVNLKLIALGRVKVTISLLTPAFLVLVLCFCAFQTHKTKERREIWSKFFTSWTAQVDRLPQNLNRLPQNLQLARLRSFEITPNCVAPPTSPWTTPYQIWRVGCSAHIRDSSSDLLPWRYSVSSRMWSFSIMRCRTRRLRRSSSWPNRR